MNRFLCIHGHFYQPPRENPWIEEIEIQDSAAPYRNWNERITFECYHANSAARILNNVRQVRDIVDNYAKISFNFGPTLLSWLEQYDKETYNAILEADKKSLSLYNGHGSAIAQVYNHLIMPLADEQDKITQIIWGIKDFEKRFNRKPEGMWLAETAVDTQTLEILAQNGIKFTILAPAQCARTRKIGSPNWQSEANGKVDPKKPYLCKLPSGNTINLFFYDGPISQAIAFGDTLKSGECFAARLLSAFDTRQDPQLVHIATDGETYGHHQKFAEMALAYCIDYVEKNHLAQITVYGEYLEKFPPQYEAQINENTSWSCIHGVERWRSNCGCNSGAHPQWHQRWRAPLRAALDFVRDSLLKTFEDKGALYYKDIWAARNAYIEVLLDRSQTHKFLETYGTPKALEDKPAALKLMEMQRNAMLMYTSCGWFFDEISGIETLQIMAYAKRALGYNKSLTGEDLEKQFIDKLAAAPSNAPALKDGGLIYRQFVKPMSLGLRKAAIHYAVSYLLDEILFEDRIFFYNISEQKVDVLRQGKARLVTGYGIFTSQITTEARKVSFAVLHSGGSDITAGAIYGQTDNLEHIREVFSFGEIEQCQSLIENSFVDVTNIKQLLKEKQRQILSNAIEKAKKRIRANFLNIFEQEHTVLEYIRSVGMPMPKLFLSLSEFVLNFELKEELHKEPVDVPLVGRHLTDLKQVNGKLDEESLKYQLTKRLGNLCEDLTRDAFDLQRATKIIDFLSMTETYALPVDLYRAQEIIFKLLKKIPANQKCPLFDTLCKKLNLNLEN